MHFKMRGRPTSKTSKSGVVPRNMWGIYEHDVVIHVDPYVNPHDSIHVQNIEKLRLKRKFQRQFGTYPFLYELYLCGGSASTIEVHWESSLVVQRKFTESKSTTKPVNNCFQAKNCCDYLVRLKKSNEMTCKFRLQSLKARKNKSA